MANSPNLNLAYIAASQAQKHITHNEALQALDAIVQLSVLDRDLTTPPASPADGSRYIIAASATGAWSGKDNQIAAWQNGTWVYYAPDEGWIAWVSDEDVLIACNGTTWNEVSGSGSANSYSLLGINATADITNRLSIKSDAVLFSHDDVTPGSGDIQTKLNKASQGQSASFLFQDNWSGRAEIGLTGDDDFHFKVSPDGSSFFEGIIIDKDTGNLSLGNVKDTTATVTIRQATTPSLKLISEAEGKITFGMYDAQAIGTQNFEITYNCSSGISNIDIDSNNRVIFPKSSGLTVEGTIATNTGGDIYLSNGALISSDASGRHSDRSGANIDHLWHDDSTNTWHFVSDNSYKATGNSTLRAASFATSSDYRLKQNITNINRKTASNRIQALRPVTYKWKKDSGMKDERHQEGFIAHELAQTVPHAVFGERDAVSSKTQKPIYQSIDYNKMFPLVVAALQEALERIEVLEAQG